MSFRIVQRNTSWSSEVREQGITSKGQAEVYKARKIRRAPPQPRNQQGLDNRRHQQRRLKLFSSGGAEGIQVERLENPGMFKFRC